MVDNAFTVCAIHLFRAQVLPTKYKNIKNTPPWSTIAELGQKKTGHCKLLKLSFNFDTFFLFRFIQISQIFPRIRLLWQFLPWYFS